MPQLLNLDCTLGTSETPTLHSLAQILCCIHSLPVTEGGWAGEVIHYYFTMVGWVESCPLKYRDAQNWVGLIPPSAGFQNIGIKVPLQSMCPWFPVKAVGENNQKDKWETLPFPKKISCLIHSAGLLCTLWVSITHSILTSRHGTVIDVNGALNSEGVMEIHSATMRRCPSSLLSPNCFIQDVEERENKISN